MREYLLVFLVSLSVTYLLTVVAREIALRTGAVAAVRDRDVHAVPIPYLGGLAMLGGLVAAYAVARELPFLSTATTSSSATPGSCCSPVPSSAPSGCSTTSSTSTRSPSWAARCSPPPCWSRWACASTASPAPTAT